MVCRYVGSRARYMVWSAVPYVDIPEKHVTCHYWTGLSHRQWDFVMTHGNLAFRTSVTLTNVINRWVWVPAYPPAYVFAAPLLRLRIRAYRRYSIHYMYVFTSTYVFCLGMVFPPVRVQRVSICHLRHKR